MSVKKIAFESEDLGMKAWEAASLTLAINEALFCGTYAAKEYEGALCALIRTTQEVCQEARALTDNLFEALENENKGEEKGG